MPRFRPSRPGTPSRRPAPDAAAYVPADPASLGVALDPALVELRSGLAAHRRRLWLRRSVRRAWYVLAVLMVAELVLAIAQRVFALEQAPLVAAALPILGLLALLVLVVRARPTLGETALAVDAEGGAGDALASALAFAGADPASAGPAGGMEDETIVVDAGFDISDAESRFIRRQRRDAVT